MDDLKTLKSWVENLKHPQIVPPNFEKDLLGIIEGLINECSYLEKLIVELRNDVDRLKFG